MLVLVVCVFHLRPRPCSPRFPYTTLFRSLRLLRRVSYRSALTAALATRLVPVLARDASRMNEAARCRPHPPGRAAVARSRSEEHTSELQSHVNLVCRLLLEKKKEIASYAV